MIVDKTDEDLCIFDARRGKKKSSAEDGTPWHSQDADTYL